MSKICHAHCPDESLGLGVLVLAAAVVAAGLAVILFVIKYLVVLGLGLAGIAVVTFALYRIALRFTVVRTAPPRRRLVAAPARTPAAISPPRRLAIEAPRSLYGTTYEHPPVIARTGEHQ